MKSHCESCKNGIAHKCNYCGRPLSFYTLVFDPWGYYCNYDHAEKSGDLIRQPHFTGEPDAMHNLS